DAPLLAVTGLSGSLTLHRDENAANNIWRAGQAHRGAGGGSPAGDASIPRLKLVSVSTRGCATAMGAWELMEKASSCQQRGQMPQPRGDHSTAQAHLEQALAIYREVQNRPSESTWWAMLSRIARHQVSLGTAERYFHQAFTLDGELWTRAKTTGTTRAVLAL